MSLLESLKDILKNGLVLTTRSELDKKLVNAYVAGAQDAVFNLTGQKETLYETVARIDNITIQRPLN
jgi:hypothetical protein